MGIKVNQFDTEGKLVAIYSSYSEAAKVLGCNESTIRKATREIKTNKIPGDYRTNYFFNYKKVFGKFYFINDDDSPVVPRMGGMYEIGEPSNLDEQPEVIEINPNKPKILFLDIETAPLRSFTWGLWKQNISLSQIISNWYIISWAARWLGDETVFSEVLTSQEAIAEDDFRIVHSLWYTLDQADIIICHNGDAFDIPKINTRFVLHGLMPPSPYRTIDTLTIARQRFGFTSNKLDFLAKFFGYEGKASTTFSLWEDCMIGDNDALHYMDFYCKQDIITLEQVFMKLRPFAKNLPNLGMYFDSEISVCSHCGSKNISLIKDKYYYTQSSKFPTFRCECGAISRGKKAIKRENKLEITSIPGR